MKLQTTMFACLLTCVGVSSAYADGGLQITKTCHGLDKFIPPSLNGVALTPPPRCADITEHDGQKPQHTLVIAGGNNTDYTIMMTDTPNFKYSVNEKREVAKTNADMLAMMKKSAASAGNPPELLEVVKHFENTRYFSMRREDDSMVTLDKGTAVFMVDLSDRVRVVAKYPAKTPDEAVSAAKALYRQAHLESLAAMK
jgi:hypothetical protein